jgi:hypothetical protein
MRFTVTIFFLSASLAGWAAAGGLDSVAEVDCRQVDRSIAREPRYIAEPRYALFVMDPAGEFRTWAVLDKSDIALPHYDVVYFDKDGDGDLTDPGERFVGKYDEKLKSMVVTIGKLTVPGTSLVHTDLKFMTTESHGYKGTYFMMKWGGAVEVSGGLGKDGTELTSYSTSSQKSPVLRPTPMGILSFIFFTTDLTIPAGKDRDVQVGIGNEGSGLDTFCVLDEHFLEPGKDVIVAMLIAKDRDGRELRTRTEFKKHC